MTISMTDDVMIGGFLTSLWTLLWDKYLEGSCDFYVRVHALKGCLLAVQDTGIAWRKCRWPSLICDGRATLL